jgi:hypothetical protein
MGRYRILENIRSTGLIFQTPLKRTRQLEVSKKITVGRDNYQTDFIKEFAGQGRQIGYNGLAYAVINSAYDQPGIKRMMRSAEDIAAPTRQKIKDPRPFAWWVFSFISLAVVWLEIGMAVMISYNTPTVGLACRSGFYVVYGITSSIAWFLQHIPGFERPGIWRKAICHFFSFLATLMLLGIIFAALCYPLSTFPVSSSPR